MGTNSKAGGPAAYQKLLKRVREITLLSSASEALAWDLETYLPPKGLDFRAEQLATPLHPAEC